MRKFQQRDDIMIYLAKVVDFYWKHVVTGYRQVLRF